MQDYFLMPSTTPVSLGGRIFRRNHPKVCPSCGCTYYTYIPDGEAWEPHRVDPEPQPGDVIQQRETCHHPACLDMEHKHQFRRKMARAAVAPGR